MIITTDTTKIELLAIIDDSVEVLETKEGNYTKEELSAMNKKETRGKWCFATV